MLRSGGLDEDAEVGLGQPLVKHGVAKLGELSIDCDGEINGQLWGAGASLASYLLCGEGKALVGSFDNWPDVSAPTLHDPTMHHLLTSAAAGPHSRRQSDDPTH